MAKYATTALCTRSVLIIASLCLAMSLTFAETLYIVGDDNAKPKNWLDAEGNPKGIIIDLLSEITERTGIKFTLDLAPWNRSFTLSANGKGAIIGFSKNQQRLESWDFSDPMYYDELVIVTSIDKQFEFSNLASLKGKRLAIKRGSSYGDDFEDARKNNLFSVIESTDRAGQMRMLTLDRVDAILLSPGNMALQSVIADNEWLIEHSGQFVILDPPYKKDPNYLGIPKSMNQSHLLPAINQALTDMQNDGTYKVIVDRNIELVLEQLKLKTQ